MQTPKNMIEVLRATQADMPLIVPLFDAYRQFYKQASDLEGAQRFLAAHFEQKTSVIFLAFKDDDEGKRHACGFIQLYPSFSSTSMKRLWILNDLFVEPETRRAGVGMALLESARDFALETHVKGLTLSTAVDNYRAQALYTWVGWKREENFYTYNLYLQEQEGNKDSGE